MNKQQAFLLLVIGVSTLAGLFVVLPFLEYTLAAIIVTYVLYPFHVRLVPHVGRRLSPLILIPIASLVVFLPLLYVALVLIRDLQAFSRGESGLDVAELEAAILETTGLEVDLTGGVSAIGGELLELLFGDISGLVSAGVAFSIGIALTLFLVYYLLKDGAAFVAWVIDVAPASNAVCDRMFQRIDRTARGVIVGHMFVAVLQGIVGGIGMLLAGIPNVVFWTFVMIVLALLPLIGAFFVWAPAAGYLYLIGQTEWAIFLLLYGVLIVSTVDNYARPIVIDRDAHLNPAIILIGVFGGVFAIGFTGLFVGPIVFAVLAATLVAFDEEYDTLGDENAVGE